MATLFLESFDGYGGTSAHATKWGALSGLGTTTPTARTGTYRCGNSAGTSTRAISPGSSTIIVGLAFYWGGANAGFIQIGRDAPVTDIQWTVVFDTDGKVRVRTGTVSGTVLDTTASAVLVASSWNFIETKILVGNSGTWTVKVNGVQVLNGSGDTQFGTDATIVGFACRPGVANGIDDLYVLDSTGSVNNDFIGDCKVECLTVQAGNGSNTGLTCSTGTDHGALVDELPANDDTDYNGSATAGVKDTYNFTNVATVGTIKAVQVSARARKTDSATKELAIVTRLSTTDYDGATQAVATTTFGQYLQVWETRPSDSAAWTISDVNAAEFGLKVVS